MKLQIPAWLVMVLLTLLRNASGQGFVNLDFEEATLVPDTSSPFQVAYYASAAIPGWTPSDATGTNTSIVAYNIAGGDRVCLFGTNAYNYPHGPLDGAYSIVLSREGPPYPGVSISQTGLVPANAVSIRLLELIPPYTAASVLVSLGGQNIPLFALSNDLGNMAYGGNIPPALAGQIEQLTLSAPIGGYWEIDDIQFSPSSVPEPRAFGLLVLGSLFFGFRHSK